MPFNYLRIIVPKILPYYITRSSLPCSAIRIYVIILYKIFVIGKQA